MRAVHSVFGIFILVGGCTGHLSVDTERTSSDVDAGSIPVPADGSRANDEDAGGRTSPDPPSLPMDAGAPDTPGVDSGPSPMPDPMPDPEPVDPCATVRCGANSTCQPSDGSCQCNPGFEPSGGACAPISNGEPANRSQIEVCDAWRDGHVENASPAWSMGNSMCATGTMSMAAIDDTVRRVNLFRWLAGLADVPYDGSRHAAMMECALMMNANNSLNHSPPNSWRCFTSGGASAAGRSNIALGYGTPGGAIDGYMDDRGTESLGHRRWILSPRLSSVEIGFAGRGQCLGVFNQDGSTDRPWTAYPNPGFAPIDLARSTWSFHVNSIRLDGDASVVVKRTRDSRELAVRSYSLGAGSGPPAIAWDPDGWTPTAGEVYRITIRGTSVGDITYETRLVNCSAD